MPLVHIWGSRLFSCPAIVKCMESNMVCAAFACHSCSSVIEKPMPPKFQCEFAHTFCQVQSALEPARDRATASCGFVRSVPHLCISFQLTAERTFNRDHETQKIGVGGSQSQTWELGRKIWGTGIFFLGKRTLEKSGSA